MPDDDIAREIRDAPERFLVAFSFAGEQRELVRPIATGLEHRLGRGTVFFDQWFPQLVGGTSADLRLGRVYNAQRSLLLVPCISKEYGDKPWTTIEASAIRAIAWQSTPQTRERDKLRVLPMRVGDGSVEGFHDNTIAHDVRSQPPSWSVELIWQRLAAIDPEVVKPRVYLGKCPPDLDNEDRVTKRSRVLAFLEAHHWKVLPEVRNSDALDVETIQKEMAKSRMFVQLLGATPFEEISYDRLEYQMAVELDVPSYQFRVSGIDRESVRNEAHREFVFGRYVMEMDIASLEGYLAKEIAALESGKCDQPEIPVLIRSTAPDRLWHKITQWLYKPTELVPYRVLPKETLTTLHRTKKCRGFVVVCDGTALQDSTLAPHDAVRECYNIQQKIRNPARQPPLGVLYWAPPLLKSNDHGQLADCFPPKTHWIFIAEPDSGIEPQALGRLIEDLRQVSL